MQDQKKNAHKKKRVPDIINQDKIHKTSKYKPEYDQMLLDHLNKGGMFETFASVVNVTSRTLYEWLKRHPTFHQAKVLGDTGSMKFWLDIGRAGVSGQLQTQTIHYETVLDSNGNPVIENGKIKERQVKRTVHPASYNSATWQLIMKNRFGWRDQRVLEHTGKDGSAIEIETKKSLKNLSIEELQALKGLITKITPPGLEDDEDDEPEDS